MPNDFGYHTRTAANNALAAPFKVVVRGNTWECIKVGVDFSLSLSLNDHYVLVKCCKLFWYLVGFVKVFEIFAKISS